MTRPGSRATIESPVPAEFGHRLRRLRERAGLTQAALAGDRLHPSYISLLESGRRLPTPDAVAALAERLGIPPDELTGLGDRDLELPTALAEAALGLGRAAEAVELLEPMESAFTTPSRTLSALSFRAAAAYADALERVGRIDDATQLLEVLAAAAETSRGKHPWLPVTVALVRCYRDAGDLARAIDVGESARQRLTPGQTIASDGHAALISTLAGAYAERGDLLRAHILLDGLLDQVPAGASLDDQACAYWNAAITAAERGDAQDGLRLAEQAATLLGLGNNMRARARVQVAKAWVLLAQRPPQAHEARRCLREALPELRQHASLLSVASAETELARCELLLGRPDIARRQAQIALRRLSLEHRIERARALTALGAALIHLDDSPAGLTCLDEAAEMLHGVDAPRQAAAVWRQQAEILTSTGDLNGALAAAERAMDASGVLAESMTPRPSTASRAGKRPPPRRQPATK